MRILLNSTFKKCFVYFCKPWLQKYRIVEPQQFLAARDYRTVKKMRGVVNYHAVDDEEDYIMCIDHKNNEMLPDIDTTEVTLTDPRDGHSLKFSECGLEFATYPTKLTKFGDFLENPDIETYSKELEILLKNKLENVAEVFVFDHLIRSNKMENRKPARHVHVDYTDSSAEKRMRDMLGDERAEEWLKDGGHFGIVNVWRPLDHPVEKDPLGFIDPSTVSSDDWHVLRIGRTNRVGVILGVEQREKHKWLVLDKMDPDMVWIFCQHDSKGLRGVPHSAVEVVGTAEGARTRRSIECRVLVRYHSV